MPYLHTAIDLARNEDGKLMLDGKDIVRPAS